MSAHLLIDGDYLISAAPNKGRVDLNYVLRWLQKESGSLFKTKSFFNVEWPANEVRSSPFIKIFRQAGFVFRLFHIDHIASKYRPCEDIAPSYRAELDFGLSTQIHNLAHDPQCSHLILIGGMDSYSDALEYFTKTACKKLTLAGFSEHIEGSIRDLASRTIEVDQRWQHAELH